MMALNIKSEVAHMEQMTVTELKRRYEEVFGEACRSNNRQWLIKRIAWRLQANEYGGLSERARARAMEIANDADLRMKAPPAKKQSQLSGDDRPNGVVTGMIATTHDSRIPMPGTILTREYKGETFQVTVLPDGFDYAGDIYKSLTAVAKTITGTHTNGFLFFKLTGKAGRK